jgi:hypothetical protein
LKTPNQELRVKFIERMANHPDEQDLMKELSYRMAED